MTQKRGIFLLLMTMTLLMMEKQLFINILTAEDDEDPDT